MDDESQTTVITITRTGDTSGTDSVLFSTADGSAIGGAGCTAGIDYVTVTNQNVTFNPGDTSMPVTVQLCGDAITEPDQTVNLSITGANLGTPSAAVLTINDTASLYRNANSIVINSGGAATPYPAEITVAGGPFVIGSMRVTLYDVTVSNPENMDVLLVAPGGQSMILQADAGGNNATSLATLNFTDTAGQVLPDSGLLTTGDFEPTSWSTVANFPPPAPAGPYNLPGSTVGGTGTQTLLGNFGGINSNGVWQLFVRDDSASGAFGDPSAIAGGWGIEFQSTTAAHASISGRVLTADGRGIRSATVVISGNALERPITVTTGSFGYFTFDGLATGETYVITVNSRRYTFSTPTRVISLVDNIADADFTADPQ
jgi:hypothetical protein